MAKQEKSCDAKLQGLKYYKSFYYKDGIKLKGWQKISKKWYYFNSSGVLQVGWLKIGSKYYYTDKSGIMLTGWQQINHKWYYLKTSGEMAANEWCKGYWLNKDGVWNY